MWKHGQITGTAAESENDSAAVLVCRRNRSRYQKTALTVTHYVFRI